MENIQNEELDFSYYINVIFKRFWLIVAMVAVGLVAAILGNILQFVYQRRRLLPHAVPTAGKPLPVGKSL